MNLMLFNCSEMLGKGNNVAWFTSKNSKTCKESGKIAKRWYGQRIVVA